MNEHIKSLYPWARNYAGGGPKKRVVTNPEWEAFQKQIENTNTSINVKASKGNYWDKNWLDPNYKSGAYTFDDNGLMFYKGQAYAPFGDRSKPVIVVPMRTPKGISYGATVGYYPVTIPQQYIEEEYYEPEPMAAPVMEDVQAFTQAADGTDTDVLQKNIRNSSRTAERTNGKRMDQPSNARSIISITNNPYKERFPDGTFINALWDEYYRRYHNNALTDEFQHNFSKATEMIDAYGRQKLYFAPDSLSPVKSTRWMDKQGYLTFDPAKEAPNAWYKLKNGWKGRFNYQERYKPAMFRTDKLVFDPNTGVLTIRKGIHVTQYRRGRKEVVGARYLLTPKAAYNETKNAVGNFIEGAKDVFSGNWSSGIRPIAHPTKDEKWGNSRGLAYGGNLYITGGQKPPKHDKYYNTVLSDQQEEAYQNWVKTLPLNLHSDYDYDLRGAYLANVQPDENYHMPDTWKKPWHPTFSNESIYSIPGTEGGRWDGEEFHPSQYNNIMRAMGKYVRWGGNSFGPGGPFKRQNLLSGMKSPEEIAAGNSDTNVQTVPVVQTKPMVQHMLSDAKTRQVMQNVADIDAQRQGYTNAADKAEKEGNVAAVLAQQGEIIPAVTTLGDPINAYNYNVALYGRNALNPMSIGANYDFDRDRLAVDYRRQQQANNWENKYNRNYGMDNAIIPAMEFSPMFPWVEGVKAFKSASQKDLKSTIYHTALALTPFMFRRLNTLFKPINKITNNQLSNVIKNTSPSNTTWNDFVKKLQIKQIIQSDIHSLPKYNLYDEGIDFTNRKLLDNIVDEAYQQIIPRLENDPFRQQLIVSKIKPSKFVKQNFDNLVDKASVVEWSKRLFDDYHRLFNSNVGGFALEDRPRIIVPKKDFHRINRNPLTKEIVEFHELRHLLQKQFPITDSEEQILKQAYSDVPQPLKHDGTIDTKYDMTKEWETMNSEGRKLLLDASHYMYDPTKTAMENIAIQNKIIDKYDPRAMLTILKESGSGYWDQFIIDIANKKLPPAQQLDYINKWKKAMQAVGVFTGVNAIDVNNLNDAYAKGGSIRIKPENRGKFTAAANRAGKSVQEYASQILANKEDYSPTLVKRANFAHVFGKK